MTEGWGHAAIAAGEFRVAEAAYREALVREPGGGRAMFGLAAALRGQGRTADADAMLTRAKKAWAKADADLPQMKNVTRRADEGGQR